VTAAAMNIVTIHHGHPQDFFQGALFLVVALKTPVMSVTANAQNTLQHFRGASPLPMPAAPMQPL